VQQRVPYSRHKSPCGMRLSGAPPPFLPLGRPPIARVHPDAMRHF
jgi:hypothetical protein